MVPPIKFPCSEVGLNAIWTKQGKPIFVEEKNLLCLGSFFLVTDYFFWFSLKGWIPDKNIGDTVSGGNPVYLRINNPMLFQKEMNVLGDLSLVGGISFCSFFLILGMACRKGSSDSSSSVKDFLGFFLIQRIATPTASLPLLSVWNTLLSLCSS